MLGCVGPAQAGKMENFKEFRELNPGINGRTLRALYREHMEAGPNNNPGNPVDHPFNIMPIFPGTGSGSPSGAPPIPSVGAPTISNTVVEDAFRKVRTNRSYQNNDGRIVGMGNGVDIDLASAERNIRLGAKLFNGADSVQIKVGDAVKTLTVGSQVTASEYLAAKQVLSGREQSLILDGQGKSTGGAVDFSTIAVRNDRLNIDDLNIPVNVTAFGDFSKNQTFRVTGDFTNAGSVYAYSTSDHARRSNFAADNITNKEGALLTTDLPTIYTTHGFSDNPKPVDLNLRATDTIANYGTISSSGDLNLSAGNNVENGGGASMYARGNVTITAPRIENAGSIRSINESITLDGPFNAELHVFNQGGTLMARDGAINIRNADFVGAYNTYVTGGNLYSQEVNVNSGRGSAEIDVDDMTGTLNQKGLASHVAAKTAVLSLGNICLTGDPTYSNTAGSISIDGDITVGEALTLIARDSITNSVPATITANSSTQGYDVTIIAGANVTAGGTSGAVGPIVPPAPAGVITTISGTASANGGDVLFNSVNINTSPNAKKGDFNGGNVRIAAFDGATNAGSVQFTGSITTGGRGTGTNGNVQIIAGVSVPFSGNLLPAINTTGGTGGGGDVSIYSSQPNSPAPITYAADGSLSSGTPLVPTTINTDSQTTMTGSISAAGNILFDGGAFYFSPDSKFSMTAQNRTTGSITLNVNGFGIANSNFISTNTLNINAGDGDVGAAGIAALQTDAANINAVGDMATSSIVISSSNKGLVLFSGSAFELNLASAGTFMSNPGAGPLTGTTVLIGSLSAGTGLNSLNPVEVAAQNLFVTAGKKGDVFAHNSFVGTSTLLDTGTMIASNTFSLVSDDDLSMLPTAVISADNVSITTNDGFVSFNGTIIGSVGVRLESLDAISNSVLPADVQTPLLNLVSTSGSIGTIGTRFTPGVNTKAINVFTPNGGVFLAGPAGVKSFELAGGFASQGYDYLGVGSTVVSGNLETALGQDVVIRTATGTLSTKSDTNVYVGGSILMQILDDVSTKIKISLGSGTTLQTFADTPGDGQITLALGSTVNQVAGTAPTKGVSPATPNGGDIFWGTAGVSAKGTNNVIADGTEVTFSNAISSKNISLGGVTIYADPPVATQSLGFVQAASFETSSLRGVQAGFGGEVLPRSGKTISGTSNITDGSNNPGTLVSSSLVSEALQQISPSMDIWHQSTLNILTAAQATAFDSTDDDDTYVISQNPTSALYAGSICSDDATYGAITAGGEQENPALGGVTQSSLSASGSLPSGRTLFVPSKDTTVETQFGNIYIGAGSVVLVSSDASGVAIYNIHDSGKHAVSIDVQGRKMSVCPGRHLLVSNNRGTDFAASNHVESVLHRAVSTSTIGDLKVHTSEFSTLSAMAGVLPLRAIIESKHPQSRKLADKMLKTTAVLLHLAGNQGEFAYFVKPRMTALR